MRQSNDLHRGSTPRSWIACWLLSLTLAPVALAQPNDVVPPSTEVVKVVAPRSMVEITERFVKVIELQNMIESADGFDPTVINVSALSPNRIRVQAIAQGITNLVLREANGTSYVIEFFVTGDARMLQSVLTRAFPDTSVTAIKVRDSVLLRGWVTEPQQITQITELAELYFPSVLNQMRVAGAQQVLVRGKLLEIQRSKLRKLGFNFAYSGENFSFASTPGVLTPLAGITTPFGGPATSSLSTAGLRNSSLAFGVVRDDLSFQGLLEAMKEEGLLKIQANGDLVSQNGAPARLYNGGEFPIPVPQALGTITIEWREFGVELEAVPTMLSPTQVQLQIKTRVSERDFTNAITLSGVTVPALTTRGEETTVNMPIGGTLVIGGLYNTRKTGQTHKVPFLGELPWIGAAFRRVNYQEVETETIILLTPEFVEAMDASQVPPGGPGQHTAVPTDRELFRDGLLEVPNYGDPCEEGCPCPPAASAGWSPAPYGTAPAGGPTPLAPSPVYSHELPPGPSPAGEYPPQASRRGTPNIRPATSTNAAAGRSDGSNNTKSRSVSAGYERPAGNRSGAEPGLIAPSSGTTTSPGTKNSSSSSKRKPTTSSRSK